MNEIGLIIRPKPYSSSSSVIKVFALRIAPPRFKSHPRTTFLLLLLLTPLLGNKILVSESPMGNYSKMDEDSVWRPRLLSCWPQMLEQTSCCSAYSRLD